MWSGQTPPETSGGVFFASWIAFCVVPTFGTMKSRKQPAKWWLARTVGSRCIGAAIVGRMYAIGSTPRGAITAPTTSFRPPPPEWCEICVQRPREPRRCRMPSMTPTATFERAFRPVGRKTHHFRNKPGRKLGTVPNRLRREVVQFRRPGRLPVGPFHRRSRVATTRRRRRQQPLDE